MTIRLGRILGLPAICGERVVGHVERAVPDENGRQVTGFIIRKGLGSAKWADRSAVTVLGDVSLVLREKPAHVPRGSGITLCTVKDEGGLTLGRVTDWWIRRDSLEIAALEITLGPLEDLRSGRKTIHTWVVQPGEEGAAVLIPREEWDPAARTPPAAPLPHETHEKEGKP